MAESVEESSKREPINWPAVQLPNGPFSVKYNITKTNDGKEIKEVSSQGSIDLLRLLREEIDIKNRHEKAEIKESLHMLKLALTPDILKAYLSYMNEIVHRHEDNESQNNKKSIVNRDLMNTNWSNIIACSHSSEGSVGVLFIECFLLPEKGADKHTLYREKIVAKPCGVSEFYNQVFVNHLAQHCGINVPQVRAIGTVSDKDQEERKSLEENLRKLYITPFHDGLYDLEKSPKSLFQSPLIMLMDQAKGSALGHRINKQRALKHQDFKAIGKLFLFDLLIRNTDRLPSRKTLGRATGNPGNIMLNPDKLLAGELWAIDNEIQLSLIPRAEHLSYVESFRSVVAEILERKHEKTVFKQINHLIFDTLPDFAGILPDSLANLWKLSSNIDKEYKYNKASFDLAINTLLQMIYLRAKTSHLVNKSHPPPEINKDDDASHAKVAWCKWIRETVPRAVADILDFVEDKTGLPIEKGSDEAFIKGFEEAVKSVVRNKESVKNSLLEADAELENSGRDSFVDETERHTIIGQHQEDREFILELIDVLTEEQERAKKRKQVWRSLLRYAVDKTDEEAEQEGLNEAK